MKTSKPNVLIIHTDQQSCWTLSCDREGGLIQTPHIDSLAEEGAIFNNFLTLEAVLLQADTPNVTEPLEITDP